VVVPGSNLEGLWSEGPSSYNVLDTREGVEVVRPTNGLGAGRWRAGLLVTGSFVVPAADLRARSGAGSRLAADSQRLE
jgi:hypothetical protein